ncbi:MAG: hypothetical protein DRP56_03880 [Planctomycetota bacterium]|nr:MAG: hypothetical protein DRP56_03880 [Planctomycetota bacterium]
MYLEVSSEKPTVWMAKTTRTSKKEKGVETPYFTALAFCICMTIEISGLKTHSIAKQRLQVKTNPPIMRPRFIKKRLSGPMTAAENQPLAKQ